MYMINVCFDSGCFFKTVAIGVIKPLFKSVKEKMLKNQPISDLKYCEIC